MEDELLHRLETKARDLDEELLDRLLELFMTEKARRNSERDEKERDPTNPKFLTLDELGMAYVNSGGAKKYDDEFKRRCPKLPCGCDEEIADGTAIETYFHAKFEDRPDHLAHIAYRMAVLALKFTKEEKEEEEKEENSKAEEKDEESRVLRTEEDRDPEVFERQVSDQNLS